MFEQEEEPIVLPERTLNKPLVSDVKARQQAYYAAYLGNRDSFMQRTQQAIDLYETKFAKTYNQVKTDLTNTGESPIVEELNSTLEAHDTQKDKELFLQELSDPNIPTEEKVQFYENTKIKKTFTFADRYAQKIAAEDVSVTKQDRESQDKNVFEFGARDIKARKEIEALQNTFYADRNVTFASTAGGITASSIPLRLSVTYANAWSAVFNDQSVKRKFVNAALVGTASKEMGKRFDAMRPEEKVNAVVRLLDYMQNSTLTDIEKMDLLQHVTNNPDQHWLETTLANASSILDVSLAGWALARPVQAVKGFINWFKYNPAPDQAVVNYIKGKFAPTKTMVGADIAVKGAKEVVDNPAIAQTVHRNDVPPNSPLGIEITHNPQKAHETTVSAILDDSGEIAKALTPEGKGQVVQAILPKPHSSPVGELGQVYPDVAERLNMYNKVLVDDATPINPALYNKEAQDSEINNIFQIIKQTKYPSLQLANTKITARTGDTTYIKATYGATPSRGWSSEKEALDMLASIKTSLDPSIHKELKVEYFNNGEWYIARNIKKTFDPNIEIGGYGGSIQMPFTTKEIGADKVFSLPKINFVFPSSSRIPAGLSSSAMATELTAAQRISKFQEYLQTFVMSKKDIHADLNKELKIVQEATEVSTWKNVGELLKDKAHLSEQQQKDLTEAYYAVKQLGDSMYELANRRHRLNKVQKNYKAIYAANGDVAGYGKEVMPSKDLPVYMWDMDNNIPIIIKKDVNGDLILDGRKIVELEHAIKKEWNDIAESLTSAEAKNLVKTESSHNFFQYAIVGAKSKLGEIPNYTLNKLDPYIPWYHTAPWFVQRMPKTVRLNGAVTEQEEKLKSFIERIAGARTQKEAEELALKMAADERNAGFTFKAVMRNEDVIQDVVDVHEEALRYAAWEKHRGEKRLGNYDPLDDPLKSMAQLGRSVIQLDAWDDFKNFFDKRFAATYSKYFPEGQKPLHPNDLRLPPGDKTPEDVMMLDAARREMEWFNGMFHSMVGSDQFVNSVFNGLAGLANKYGLPGEKTLRTMSKQGNVVVRVPNAMATHLMIYYDILRQWVVQPQNISNLVILDPNFARYGLPNLVPFIFATMGRASYFKQHESQFLKISRYIGSRIAGMSHKEWDDMYHGFINSGITQGVDLNVMVQGLIHNNNFSLSPEVHEKIGHALSSMASTPGNIMKVAGYTPAELTNYAGAWMYSWQQYRKLHPNVDMRNVHHIEQVKAKAAALTGSMAGKSDVLDYQKGAWSLLFKFMPINSKQMALTLSSKAVTKEEKQRLAISQALWFGTGGVLGGEYILTNMVNSFGSEEDKRIYHQYKGGMIDLLMNKLIIEGINSLMGVEEQKETELAFSTAMAPFAQGSGFPAFEVFKNVSKSLTDAEAAGQTRIAALAVFSKIAQYVQAVDSKVTVQGGYDTPEAAMALITELPTLVKGLGNLEQSYLMYQAGRLVDKYGNKRDLVATHAEAIGRAFSLRTIEEQYEFKNIDLDKARKATLKTISKQIVDHIMKHRTDLLGMSQYGRTDELDKLLFLAGVNNPEDLDAIKKQVNKALYYKNKEFEAALTPQLHKAIEDAKTSTNNAKKENHSTFLGELLDWLTQ